MIEQLRADAVFTRDVSAWQFAPAQAARTAPFPSAIRQPVVEMLKRRGIDELYIHQAQAIEAALRGENVAVVASAAGGKSLCFAVPILNTLAMEPDARALCLFPTKALAQDQLSTLRAMLGQMETAQAAKSITLVNAYDGDTPQGQRADIRREARVVVSNADMLHIGILPHHTRWAAFFKNLKFVVIDELHVYRGVMGSHVANVIRRLRRVCQFYGAKPVFILASATIANPKDHAERLIEQPVTLVNDDGSPRGERHVIIVNPPMVDAEMGVRRSSAFVARDIAARFVGAGLQTICFARTRQDTEVLLTYLREKVDDRRWTMDDISSPLPVGLGSSIVHRPSSPRKYSSSQKIAGYRGGYLPEERRAIEKGLRNGEMRGVVATNALELGIDIGELDACVMQGYPGSIASFWQQAGRAGRRRQTSLAVMVANATALDQYLAQHPEYLFRQSPEFARIDPNNLGVLAAHVACATFELPFVRGENFGGINIDELLDALAEEGDVHASGTPISPMFAPEPKTKYTWVGESYPANAVSLRGAGDRVIVLDTSGNLIGDTERVTAPSRVHVGAIYIHQGEPYQIVELDWENGRATARKTNADYFTDASVVSEVRVLKEFETKQATEVAPNEPLAERRPAPAHLGVHTGGRSAESPQDAISIAQRQPHSGELEVTSRAVRYREVQFNTHRTLNWGVIDLPDQHLFTTGYWFAVPEEMAKQLAKEGVLKLPNEYGPNWQAQRSAARARDGYVCQVCGKPESAMRQHDVHHKVPFRTFGYIPGENDNYLRANVLENLMTVCSDCHPKIETAESAPTALEGLAYLLGNLAPLFVMCDPGDLSVNADWHSAHMHLPTITIYELTSGGTGLCEELAKHHAALLGMATERMRECACERGCPACVGPTEERHSRNLKADTMRLIEMLS